MIRKTDPALRHGRLGAANSHREGHRPDAGCLAAVGSNQGAAEAEPGQLRQPAKQNADA